jgi:MoxR-like ATPase
MKTELPMTKPSTSTNSSNKFVALKEGMNKMFPERRDQIEGSLASILAGEHVLFLGPPGTAKSAMVRAFANTFKARYFERLLTKFSAPDEVFGPISLQALEAGRFERVTIGKLPESEIAFVDEIFKANSAILNSMLTVMNERLYHNDTQILTVPLISMFGASNELPEGKELEALFDRFMMRFEVKPLVRQSSVLQMLRAAEPTAPMAITLDELRAEQAAAAAVEIPENTIDILMQIREGLMGEGLMVSDRRLKKTLKLVKAFAHMSGNTEALPEDLAPLTDAFWREPSERGKVSKVVGKLSDPIKVKVQEIIDSAHESYQKVSGMRNMDRAEFMSAAVKSVHQFRDQVSKMDALSKTAGKRASDLIAHGKEELKRMDDDFSRAVRDAVPTNIRR